MRKTQQLPAKVRQVQILEAISRFWGEHGYPPSFQDLADDVGVGKQTIHHHLHEMVKQGLIRMTPGVSRSITITESVMKAPEETM